MQSVVYIAGGGGLEEQIAQGSRGSPAFLEAQRGAQRLSRNVEASAFVAENVAPAAGARRPSGGVAAERKRAGAGYSDDPWLAGCRSGEGDQAVMRDDQRVGGKDLGKQRLFVFRSAAHTEAGRLIASLGRVELRLR